MKGLLLTLLLSTSFAQADVESFVEIPEHLYDLNRGPKVKQLIEINTVKYPTNEHASYCKRPVEVIDTIVFHHSETRSTDTPLRINAYHLDRGSASDPWWMVAYTYLINTPYVGGSIPTSAVSYGRPISFVGAHAGSNVFVPMDETQKKIWDSGEIKCGRDEDFAFDPSLVKNGKIKANVTTIGVVAIGNYAPGGPSNPNGSGSKGRSATPKLIDMLARLSCQVQKEYPRIKRFAYHDQYHATSCPGTIKNNMKAIKAKAKEYGCEFEIVSGKYY